MFKIKNLCHIYLWESTAVLQQAHLCTELFILLENKRSVTKVRHKIIRDLKKKLNHRLPLEVWYSLFLVSPNIQSSVWGSCVQRVSRSPLTASHSAYGERRSPTKTKKKTELNSIHISSKFITLFSQGSPEPCDVKMGPQAKKTGWQPLW